MAMGDLLAQAKLPLRFTQRVGIGNFVERHRAGDVHGFSEIIDHDSQPVFWNASI